MVIENLSVFCRIPEVTITLVMLDPVTSWSMIDFLRTEYLLLSDFTFGNILISFTSIIPMSKSTALCKVVITYKFTSMLNTFEQNGTWVSEIILWQVLFLVCNHLLKWKSFPFRWRVVQICIYLCTVWFSIIPSNQFFPFQRAYLGQMKHLEGTHARGQNFSDTWILSRGIFS